jgi:DNA-binding MarR family transcriptional regulator
MVKRKVGERARILFDDIDLKILNLLNKNLENNPNVFYSVLELADKLYLKHKNLKPHIDKLLMLELVSIRKDSDGKTRILSEINTEHKIIEKNYKTKEDYIKALKEEEKKRALLFYLAKTNLFLAIDNALKNKEFDIRKMKRKTSIGSNITTK